MHVKASYDDVVDFFDKINDTWVETVELEKKIKNAIESMPSCVSSKKKIAERMNTIRDLSNAVYENVNPIFDVEFCAANCRRPACYTTKLEELIDPAIKDDWFTELVQTENKNLFEKFGSGLKKVWDGLKSTGEWLKDATLFIKESLLCFGECVYDIGEGAVYGALIGLASIDPSLSPVDREEAKRRCGNAFIKMIADGFGVVIPDMEMKKDFREFDPLEWLVDNADLIIETNQNLEKDIEFINEVSANE